MNFSISEKAEKLAGGDLSLIALLKDRSDPILPDEATDHFRNLDLGLKRIVGIEKVKNRFVRIPVKNFVDLSECFRNGNGTEGLRTFGSI